MKPSDWISTAGAGASLALLWALPLWAQTPGGNLPRTSDGKPDFNGIWQATNTAAVNLEDHSGALNAPPGLGVVENGEIPYRPDALKRRQDNFANREKYDLAASGEPLVQDVEEVNPTLKGKPLVELELPAELQTTNP